MKIHCFLVAMLLAAPLAWSDTAPPQARGARAELWVVVNSWPALEEIRPSAGGTLDALGAGLGGALYVTLRELPGSELLVGVDGFIVAHDTSVEGVFFDVLARQAYLGGSLKWVLGRDRRFSLDTGLGYHLVDMAEVDDGYSGFEREVWEASRVSAYLGATWDFPTRSLGSPGRWMLGLKAYMVDFGAVHGPWPIGRDAGRLDGPQYLLQIGYGTR